MDEQGLSTVYRSPRRRDCDERLLVLTAVGVSGIVVLGEGTFLLQVPTEAAGYATRHLLQYESENRATATATAAAAVVSARLGRLRRLRRRAHGGGGGAVARSGAPGCL